MSSPSNAPTITTSFGGSERRDAWWVEPVVYAIILLVFGVYSTWAAAQGNNYAWGPYLSPLYSPLIKPSWLPHWVSPAFLILIFPLGFRATCYYYRKAYYRAFFLDPWACAVGEGTEHGYSGERNFPFILQNLHRYFLYAALVFLVILGYDTVMGFIWPVAGGGHRFGMGLGSLVLLINWILLTGYTLGCHSLRHLIGGKIDCFSCATFGKERHEMWQAATWFNKKHQNWAWASLIFVGLTDLYIRLVAMGVWHDIRFF
ncbi:MAG TPA: hypothetical protein V6D47_07200 [Oscillatoriaceae cyanobacterium]